MRGLRRVMKAQSGARRFADVCNRGSQSLWGGRHGGGVAVAFQAMGE